MREFFQNGVIFAPGGSGGVWRGGPQIHGFPLYKEGIGKGPRSMDLGPQIHGSMDSPYTRKGFRYRDPSREGLRYPFLRDSGSGPLKKGSQTSGRHCDFGVWRALEPLQEGSREGSRDPLGGVLGTQKGVILSEAGRDPRSKPVQNLSKRGPGGVQNRGPGNHFLTPSRRHIWQKVPVRKPPLARTGPGRGQK